MHTQSMDKFRTKNLKIRNFGICGFMLDQTMMKTYGQVRLIATDWRANMVLFIFNDHGTRLNKHLHRYLHLHSRVTVS